jgi:hypothetical protein
MQVIQEIRKNGFDRIESELGIKVKEAGGYVLLDYCQINSPKLDPIVKECRGLILDEETLEVACRSFDRFFNYGEGDAQNLDFRGCKVVEKVDGSLIRVWYDPKQGEWVVSTRGTIFADSPVMGNNFTFHELFVRVFCDSLGFPAYDVCFQNHCNIWFYSGETYIFELATPYNRVVTPYSRETLKLLAVRDNEDGCYVDTSDFRQTFETPISYNIGSFEDCIKASQELGGLKEGFVVIDQNRVPVCKIKSPAYVAVHHIRSNNGLNPKSIIKLITTGEVEEYLTYYPEDSGKFSEVIVKWENLLGESCKVFDACNSLESQKDFAISIKDCKLKSAMFGARKSGVNLKEFIDNSDVDFRSKLLEIVV